MNNKKKISIVLGATVFSVIGLTQVFAATGIVNTETLRIRASASTSSKIIDMANQGESIEILGEENDWYKVKYNGKEGYGSKAYVSVKDGTTIPTSTTPVPTAEPTPVQTPVQTPTPTPTATPTPEPTPEENEPTTTPNSEQAPDNDTKEKVLGNVVNRETHIYLTPNFSSIKISKIEAKKSVTKIKTLGNWTKVSIDNNEAWIPNNVLYIEDGGQAKPEEPTTTTTPEPEVTPTPEPTQSSSKSAYISSNSAVNLRLGPGTSYETIQSIPTNAKITITSEENDNWYKVTYDGKEGYVSRRLVTIGEPPVSSRSGDIARETEQQISSTTDIQTQNPETSATSQPATSQPVASSGNVVSLAQSYLGSRYVNGGASPTSGFDCSGFTQYIYGQCGVSLSRTSQSQANNGTAISKEELQPGDLVLFTYYGGQSIGHVGIYVGNGQFIHAANAKRGVVYDTIESGYYAQNYAGARRVQ